MDWQTSYASARTAVERAVSSLNADEVTRLLRKFPVLRIHACDVLRRSTRPFQTSLTDRELLANLVTVLEAILSRYAAPTSDEWLCSKRLVRHFRQGGTKLLRSLLQQMLSDATVSKGCGLFIVSCLDHMTSGSNQKRVEGDLLQLLRLHRSKFVAFSKSDVYCGPLWDDSDANPRAEAEEKRLGVRMETPGRPNQGATQKRPRFFIVEDREEIRLLLTQHSPSRHPRNGYFECNSCSDCLLEVISLWAVRPASVLRCVDNNGAGPLIIELITRYFLEGEEELMSHVDSHLTPSFRAHADSLLEKLQGLSTDTKCTAVDTKDSSPNRFADVGEIKAMAGASQTVQAPDLMNAKSVRKLDSRGEEARIGDGLSSRILNCFRL